MSHLDHRGRRRQPRRDGAGLRRFGFDADFAGTFLEGAAKLTPEVRWLILDLRLPDGDCAALLGYIRSHEWPVHVAVVTGAQDGRLLSDAVLLRPDALFTKPVDFADVARWMASSGQNGDAGPAAAERSRKCPRHAALTANEGA